MHGMIVIALHSFSGFLLKRNPDGFLIRMRSPAYLPLPRVVVFGSSWGGIVCPGGWRDVQSTWNFTPSLGSEGLDVLNPARWRKSPQEKELKVQFVNSQRAMEHCVFFSIKLWENQAFNTIVLTSNQSNIGSLELFYFEVLAYLSGIKAFPNWL